MKEGQVGRICTNETRIKMKNAHESRTIYHTHNAEEKRKISNKLKWHTVSKETRLKISKRLKGRIKPEEETRKMRETLKGHAVSKETRLKISRATTGRVTSDQTKKKQSLAKKLDKKKIIEIKKMLLEGFKGVEISKKLNICKATVSKYKKI